MNLLIKNATVLCKGSKYHGKKRSLRIQNGVIVEIATSIAPSQKLKVVEADGLYVSAGFCDIFTQIGDPGFEHKETLDSACAAALAGGYTHVAVLPNTNPTTHTKAQVQYLTKQSQHKPVTLLPLGAVTNKIEGKSLAEMLDMRSSGAVAFTDGLVPIQDTAVMLKALQYVKAIDGTIIQVPVHAAFSGGLMHEGEQSIQLGLQGVPAIAELMMVQRDIALLKYTDSKLHLSAISTAEALAEVTKAQKAGYNLTCSVTPHHLLFTDKSLSTYNSVYKVQPPLRTQKDIAALIKGINSGVVNAIASHHSPQDWDAKHVEFEYAKPGMIHLQTCFLSLLSLLKSGLELEALAHAVSNGARQCLGIAEVNINENEPACLTIFSTKGSTMFDAQSNKSLSANSPLLETQLQGQILGTYHKGQYNEC